MAKIIPIILLIILSFVAKGLSQTIDFHQPDAAISDLAAAGQAGGSLVEDTTYYYIVLASNLANGTSFFGDFDGWITGRSNEVSFTATAVNKSVELTWTDTVGGNSYFVYRSTVSGVYTGSSRIQGANRWYATCGGSPYTDDGTGTFDESFFYPALYESTDTLPANLDPAANGCGYLDISGGTAIAPITLQDIADQLATDGDGNWYDWDKQRFTLLGHLNWKTATETHFKETDNVITILGGIYIDCSHASSNIQFGEIDSNTKRGINGCAIYYYGARPWEFRPEENAYFYDCYIRGMIGTAFDLEDLNQQQIHKLERATNIHLDTSLSRIDIMNIQWADIPLINFRTDLSLSYTLLNSGRVGYGNVTNKFVRVVATGAQDQPRLDRNTAYRTNTSYEVFLQGAGQTMKDIDFNYPRTTDTDHLPLVYWYSDAGNASWWEGYNSLEIRATDKDENPITTAKLTLRDVNDAVADDWDGGLSITGLSADSQGYFWREAITVTSATTTTITDSSKSWATDEWKGRNVKVVTGTHKGKLLKVKSNTADTLALLEEMPSALSVDDICGIRLEVKRAKLAHSSGSNGYGAAHTAKTLYTPHRVEIRASGFLTYKKRFTLDKPIVWQPKLFHSPYEKILGIE